MISNKRNRKKYILRASTKHGTGTRLAGRRTRSRRKPDSQGGLEPLRHMIVRGELGIYKLLSSPQEPPEISQISPVPEAHDSAPLSKRRSLCLMLVQQTESDDASINA